MKNLQNNSESVVDINELKFEKIEKKKNFVVRKFKGSFSSKELYSALLFPSFDSYMSVDIIPSDSDGVCDLFVRIICEG